MTPTSLTLAFDGKVTLDCFAHAVKHLGRLVGALTKVVAPGGEVRWFVADAVGGVQVTLLSGAEQAEPTSSIASAFLAIGQALADGREPPGSPQVVTEARALARVLDGGVRSLRFETREGDVLLAGSVEGKERQRLIAAFEALEGRIQSVPSDIPWRFVLYDRAYDRPVSCYLREDGREAIRGWGRRAVVEGWVTRDAVLGWPVTVRSVEQVALQDDAPPGYYLMRARGILPAAPGDPSPEERIRRLRDAWDG